MHGQQIWHVSVKNQIQIVKFSKYLRNTPIVTLYEENGWYRVEYNGEEDM